MILLFQEWKDFQFQAETYIRFPQLFLTQKVLLNLIEMVCVTLSMVRILE